MSQTKSEYLSKTESSDTTPPEKNSLQKMVEILKQPLQAICDVCNGKGLISDKDICRECHGEGRLHQEH